MMLEIKDLDVYYGKAQALHAVSMNIHEGEIVAIVGANGAGKTTLIRTISGLQKSFIGEILFHDMSIGRKPAHEIAKLGIIQIPAGRMIFSPMSVMDNLRIGAYLRKDKDGIEQDLEGIYEHFPILKVRKSQPGGQLSGGEQQMLAVARALMAKPRLLLMDEPSLGLSPILVDEVSSIIQDINESGISILLVEQNCHMALQLCKRAYVLEQGRISLEGESEELANDGRIQKYYLGG